MLILNLITSDGNAWSSRFEQLLLTGSVIMKSTIMRKSDRISPDVVPKTPCRADCSDQLAEWWTDRIQPWVHFIPIQVDYSDVYDVIAYVSL